MRVWVSLSWVLVWVVFLFSGIDGDYWAFLGVVMGGSRFYVLVMGLLSLRVVVNGDYLRSCV